ncbi:MAG: DNA replication and repair protein RecF [Acidobacteria bacterium]|nr:DNA replication and repair protein RecF [Acidobacteriota bacterium]
MHLTRLRLFNYRNIRELEIVPSAETNLISGLNGQGKTNLLEAIYLLGYGKSFRTAVPRDCIRHGQKECRVEGTVQHGTLTRDLQVSISISEKKLFVLGKPVPLDAFVGNLQILAFTHEHLNVVRGTPADRRSFLDRAMVNLFPGHISDLAAYGRSLRQRNRLLSAARDGSGRIDDALLDSWDEALIKPGTRIISNRLRYSEMMKQQLPQGLFGADVFKIHYLSSIGAESPALAEIEGLFRRRLVQARASDRRTGYTSPGPHRDDLKLYVNGKALADFGSAGQQRSCLLSLYFSQMEIHQKVNDHYPVFLVDDAEAELDEQRLHTFLSFLARRTQVFLTSAKEFLVSSVPENTLRFEVWNGAATPLGTGRPGETGSR